MLERVGIPCRVQPSRVVETADLGGNGADPAETCLLNARLKAEQVAAWVEEQALVLAADTIVVVDDLILGKPEDTEDARRMLQLLSGRRHQVLTGCVILDPGRTVSRSFAVATGVVFKSLEPDEIDGYVATGEPLDKAGGYGIQGRGAFLVASVHGSYTNVVGLPLAEVLDVLAEVGGPRPFRANG